MGAMTGPVLPDITPEPTGGTYREGLLALAPPWLLMDNEGNLDGRYLYSMGITRDAVAEWFRLGVLQRFPEYTDETGLGFLGRDRGIFRGISEDEESYAIRLRQYIATWRLAGNAPTLLRQLWALLAPDTVRIRYVVNGYTGTAGAGTQFADWWTIDDDGLTYERVSPTNWDWDGGTIGYGKQARFWLIIYRSDVTPITWGGPEEWGDDDLRWGTGFGPVDWIADTRRVTLAFRAAGSRTGPWGGGGGGLIVADPTFVTAPWDANGPFYPGTAPGYPMPDGTFSDPSARPPGAIYLSGF